MTKPVSARNLYPLWILAGEVLIVLGFYLLTEDLQRGATAWLNLAVCMLAFLINTAGPLYFMRRREEFGASIPALGILWSIHGFYTAAAITVMVLGAAWGVPFRAQLLWQSAVLLGLAGVALAAHHAEEHAGAVAEEQGGELGRLDLLRDEMEALARRCGRVPALEGLVKPVGRCVEDARYLSPAGDRRAAALEARLLGKIREAQDAIADHGLPGSGEDQLRAEVARHVEELTVLFEERRACPVRRG